MIEQIAQYTRETVFWDKEAKCFVHGPTGSVFRGKGVTRFLYGYKKPDKDAKQRMDQGVSLHKQAEQNAPEDKSAIAICNWIGDNCTDKVQEAFLHGKLFGLDAVAFADLICTYKGKLALLDFKFSGLPANMQKQKNEWPMQLVLEAVLAEQMHGIAIDQFVIVTAKPGTAKAPLVLEYGKEVFADLYLLARQKAINNGLIA